MKILTQGLMQKGGVISIFYFQITNRLFFEKYSYYYHQKIDCIKLNELSRSLIGEKDFTSFARKNTETEINKICHVNGIQWKETKKGLTIFFIEADRYLHGMVRTIIGTLLTGLKEGKDKNYIEEIFSAKNRELAGESVLLTAYSCIR